MNNIKLGLTIIFYFSFLFIIVWGAGLGIALFKTIVDNIKNREFTFIKSSKDMVFSLSEAFFSKSSTKETRTLKILFAIGVLYPVIMAITCQSTEIGSVFEKQKYKTSVYVNLFPYNDESKNYRLKADIESSMTFEELLRGDRYYKLEKIHFNNGGYITFDNIDWDKENTLILNKQVYFRDDKDNSWYIELTKEKVKK